MAHGCDLTRVCVEIRDQSIEFILRGPPIALLAFTNEPEPFQCDPDEIYRLDFDRQTVNRSSV